MINWTRPTILCIVGGLGGIAALSLMIVWATAAGSAPGSSPPEESPQAVSRELRGAWSGWRVEPDWDRAMAELSQANFNAVFPYVCSPGVAYYDSKVLPVSKYSQEHDPLAEAVAFGQKHSIAVHARILTLELLFAEDTTEAEMRQAGRLMKDAQSATIRWLCPTDPRNRDLLRDMAVELVTKYDIAGLQFDYLRYPGKNTCLCERCRRQFVADTGTEVNNWPKEVITGPLEKQFNKWRQQQITDLLDSVVKASRAARPDIIVSAAVFPNWQRHSKQFGQDVEAWVESGLMDFVCPMNYTSDRLDFATWILRQRKAISGRVPLIVGLGPFSDACQFTGPEQLGEQIQIARAFGAGGFIIFKYQQELVQKYLPYLTEEITAQPAQPIRHQTNREN